MLKRKAYILNVDRDNGNSIKKINVRITRQTILNGVNTVTLVICLIHVTA